jgi:hypothetical protein
MAYRTGSRLWRVSYSTPGGGGEGFIILALKGVIAFLRVHKLDVAFAPGSTALNALYRYTVNVAFYREVATASFTGFSSD